jgi:uncharacterized protein YidB (DUF937 family)
MSILSTLTGALEGAQSNATGTGLNPAGAASGGLVLSQIISLIQNHPGGIGGLLQSFQQGGLGHLVQSWIGTGQNLPVSPDQLRSTLGGDWISRITQATGLPQGQVEQSLSTLLPQIVDHLTPNGQLPQGDVSGELAKIAQRVLHGAGN